MIKNNNSVLNSNSKSGSSASANSNLTSKAMATQSNPKKHFPYYKFVIYSFLFVILMLPIVIVTSGTLATYFQATKSTTSLYYNVPYESPTEECRVTNTSASISYMVPVKTPREWTAFKSADSRLTDLSVSCLTPCTPKTCSDLIGMALVNGGYNCGAGLSDGCGGTLTCYDNCAWDEICSAGPVGGECALGYLCGDSLGHCRYDNGCVPVIDDIAYNADQYGRLGCLMYGETGFTSSSEACSASQTSGAPYPTIYNISGGCFISWDGSGHGSFEACYSVFPDASPTPYHIIGDDDNYPYHGLYNANDQMFEQCQEYTPSPPPSPDCVTYCTEQGWPVGSCEDICESIIY